MIISSRKRDHLNYQTHIYRKDRSCLVACILLILLIHNIEIRASSDIEIASDVLQFALPSAAATLILGYKDRQGALQFGSSTATTLAVTYGLKYTINEKRPNGGEYSFPSRHTSLSFSVAEFMRKRYGWNYGVPAYAFSIVCCL